MKKLLALIFALLMTILIFASCDTGGEISFPAESSSSKTSAVNKCVMETIESSDEYTISRIRVEDDYLYLLEFVNQDGTVFGLYFENIPPGISVFSENVYKIVVTAGTGVARVQYYDVLKKELITSEEESSIPVKSPIPYTEEDQKYFEKYVLQLVFAPEFSDPNELDASGLFAFFARMYNAYEADDYGDKYYGEDGLYHVPLADVTDILNRYLGEGYSEKVKQCSFYNSKTKYFDAPAFDPVGGGWGFELFPFPIQREGKCVVVPFYIFDEESSKIVNAHEFTIEEYKEGFYVRKNIRLTEEEIADLNEKYFGEA